MNMHMCVSACAAAWLISEEPARLDRLLRKKNRRHTSRCIHPDLKPYGGRLLVIGYSDGTSARGGVPPDPRNRNLEPERNL